MMKLRFSVVSLTHKDTPVEIREKFSLDENEVRGFLLKLREALDIEEALVVSTCNRTEVYYSGEQSSETVVKLLCAERGLDFSRYRQYFNIISRARGAVNQLFRVSLGLDAQVLGDLQISNQIKQAYQMSADAQMAGPFLHRLMHTIFFANKRVVQETSLRDGAASTSYAATELVQDLTQKVKDSSILLVGVGEIGENVCRNLADAGVANVKVTNRTKIKATELTEECGFEFIDFSQLEKAIDKADVVITSISSTGGYLINKESLTESDLLTFKYFIDLSVPRTVDPKVEELRGVVLYNIDQVRSRADEALQKRIDAIPEVEKIIEESLSDFAEWAKEMEVSPTIQKLKNALEEIRRQEVERNMKNMNSEEVEKVEIVTKNIMQKIIKLPVLQLKAACKRGEAETLIDVMNDLFDLEKQAHKK